MIYLIIYNAKKATDLQFDRDIPLALIYQHRMDYWNKMLNLLLFNFFLFTVNCYMNTWIEFKRQRINIKISNSLKIAILTKILKVSAENKNRSLVDTDQSSEKTNKVPDEPQIELNDLNNGEGQNKPKDQESTNSTIGYFNNLLNTDSNKFANLVDLIN